MFRSSSEETQRHPAREAKVFEPSTFASRRADRPVEERPRRLSPSAPSRSACRPPADRRRTRSPTSRSTGMPRARGRSVRYGRLPWLCLDRRRLQRRA